MRFSVLINGFSNCCVSKNALKQKKCIGNAHRRLWICGGGARVECRLFDILMVILKKWVRRVSSLMLKYCKMWSCMRVSGQRRVCFLKAVTVYTERTVTSLLQCHGAKCSSKTRLPCARQGFEKSVDQIGLFRACQHFRTCVSKTLNLSGQCSDVPTPSCNRLSPLWCRKEGKDFLLNEKVLTRKIEIWRKHPGWY